MLLLSAAFSLRPIAIDSREHVVQGDSIAPRRHAALRMSWTGPEWQWGSAAGKAHDAAQRLRASLSTEEARDKFLTGVGMMDEEDFEDSKVVLALKIQRASKRCFAAAHGLEEEEQCAWRSLMDELAACRFEGYRGNVLLAEAIIERLGLIEGKRLASL
jgi:hypothetical protein